MADLRADGDPTPAADLPPARPAVDAIAMEAVRASAERALFGAAEPARLGRYLLLDRSAGGGMGIVHEAYDPQLDRKVALKRVHPRQIGADGARQRLIVEARALAKLDHPNVVKVHDVLTGDGQVVIVMELAEGQTLAAWERARPRTWREIIAVYAQAGDGLAAAHGVDVVHRDFKPANAIVGADGRVRVLDFGLARFAGDDDRADGASVGPDRAPPGPGSPLDLALTATGAIVGTLGYTAPEQLDGQRATAASDQFSFCVSLHRAIEGVHPFAADSTAATATATPGDPAAALAGDIRAGIIRRATDGRRVPPWLRAAIARGLAADPARRHPSMQALVALLRRPRGWKRWRGPAALAGVAVIAAGIAVVLGGRAPAARASCDGGEAWAAAAWNPARRALVSRALAATATPYGRQVHDHALAGLDRYSRDAIDLRRDACLAHGRGERSAVLFDRQMRCLDHRRADQAAAVDVLARIDATRLDNAVEVVARMPPIAQCAALEALQAELPPPSTPAARREVDAVRARLSQAAALERAGRSPEALTVADDALAQAGRVGYPAAEVEAGLVKGRVLMFSGRCADAVAPLLRAEHLALGHQLWPAAVEAAARRLFCESRVADPDGGRLRAQAAIYQALSRELRDHFARPLLLNNLGTIEMVLEQRAAALAHFQAARAALDGVAEPDLELTVIDKNLAMLTRDGPTRETNARRAWERLRDALGVAHPLTLDALHSVATYTTDPAAALALEDAACAQYHTHHPDQLAARAACAGLGAFLAAELDQPAQATARFRAVVALTAGSDEDDASAWHALASGHVHLADGDPAGALTAFQRLLDRFAASDHWWDKAWAADAHLGAGLAERARGRLRPAADHLEQAIARYEVVTQANEELHARRRLARARLTLAAVLRDLGDPTDRPAALEEQARQFQRLTAGRGVAPPSPPP